MSVTIEFPRHPDKTIEIATFKVSLDKEYEVCIEKQINGTTTYSVALVTKGVHPEVQKLIEDMVRIKAEKDGVFNKVTNPAKP
jgi:hypothetical protein